MRRTRTFWPSGGASNTPSATPGGGRGQRSEIRGQRSEIRGQRSDEIASRQTAGGVARSSRREQSAKRTNENSPAPQRWDRVPRRTESVKRTAEILVGNFSVVPLRGTLRSHA